MTQTDRPTRKWERTATLPRISAKQIRALWGYASRLLIPEEDLREWVFIRTGKRSLRALTRPQATRLIEEIAQKWQMGELPSASPPSMTSGQARILTALEEALGWDDRRLLGLARKMYRVDELQALQPIEAAGLIEALKAIRQRKTA